LVTLARTNRRQSSFSFGFHAGSLAVPHFIAQGGRVDEYWRHPLEPDRSYVVGRTVGDWCVPWDNTLSRRHFAVCYRQGRLEVTQLPAARNPIFWKGESVDRLQLRSGEHFVVGNTSFLFLDQPWVTAANVPHPITAQTFSHQELHQQPFRRAAEHIEALCRLPEIIANAADEEQLCKRLVSLLLANIRHAELAAVITAGVPADGPITIRHGERRWTVMETLVASEQLIRTALLSGHSELHFWDATRERSSTGSSSVAQVAAAAGTPPAAGSTPVQWAFCTPVPGDACAGWALYVAGRQPADPLSAAPWDQLERLRDDVKFTELAASTLGNLRQLKQLERQRTTLGQFISPVILQAVADRDPELVLAPQVADVTVLFCDLRGFSQVSEQASDKLLELLQRVSEALGVMTRHILAEGGVVGDFHGDSAMGFWGWPLPQPDAAERACRTALAIRREFSAANRAGDPLRNFRVGIGIASGRAVAGKIGTVDQVKLTVFGPVVNLASRLEGMTKQFKAPILMDEPTAAAIRQAVGPSSTDALPCADQPAAAALPTDQRAPVVSSQEGTGRPSIPHRGPHRAPRLTAWVRRVARVKPFGLQKPLEVSELLPAETAESGLTESAIRAYEQALDALLAGDWEEAFLRLHEVPATDRVKDFLTILIAQHNRTPPPDWQGVIPLATK
jgi:adenylate cyclase